MKAFAILIPLTLAGCANINRAVTIGVEADAKLRSSCAYLEDGVRIARLAAGFISGASAIVDRGAVLMDAYCSGRSITDISSALALMERVIVAVRPIAARVSPQ